MKFQLFYTHLKQSYSPKRFIKKFMNIQVFYIPQKMKIQSFYIPDL